MCRREVFIASQWGVGGREFMKSTRMLCTLETVWSQVVLAVPGLYNNLWRENFTGHFPFL